VDKNTNYFVDYPADKLPGVDVPVGDVYENSFVECPTDKIPGVEVKSNEVKLPGVDKDFDAEPIGVEVDTGAYGKTYDAVTNTYGKAYDAVPQEQGTEIEVYGLGQQDPKGKKPNIVLTWVKHKVAMTQVMTLLFRCCVHP
jgi:hypothetical protein